jgi:Family of unknown function (DUF5681)
MKDDRDKTGRFQTGTSGNPRGRPKRSQSVDAAVARALLETVTVNEQGRRRKRPKLEVTAAQIANKGASGDYRFAKLGLELARKAEERDQLEASHAPVMTESDHEIAARFIARLTMKILAGKGEDEGTK